MQSLGRLMAIILSCVVLTNQMVLEYKSTNTMELLGQ